MQRQFEQLAQVIESSLQGSETYTANFAGERSEFARLNHSRIRQAGTVEQRALSLRLLSGRRHLSGSLSLSGQADHDHAAVRTLVAQLRSRLDAMPEDPYLLLNPTRNDTTRVDVGDFPDGPDAVARVIEVAGRGGVPDLVGIYASGEMSRGFASSTGQRNWHSTQSFSLDWSLVHSADRAVKSTWAGRVWADAELEARMDSAKQQLQRLRVPPKTINPGRYRAYLAPAAVEEILQMVGYEGFSAKAQHNQTSCLMRLVRGTHPLSPMVSIRENIGAGAAPGFQSEGFVLPAVTELIRNGSHVGPLISPRSAAEYGLVANTRAAEEPDSLQLDGGELDPSGVLKALGTGIYVSNLWYLNFSDPNACRLTGMTRFATFWVEDGEIVAPLSVMRFDDSLFDLFGARLEGLTSTVELRPSVGTYGQRSLQSVLVPGALVDGITFTL